MKKLYFLIISLFTTILFSQQLDADLQEINFRSGIVSNNLIKYHDKILYTGVETENAGNNTNSKLWFYDTITKKNQFIAGLSSLKVGDQLFIFNDKIYFIVNGSSGRGKQLWTTDLTTAGTKEIFEFSAADNSITEIFKDDNKIIFATYNKLYVSDGTATGSRLLKESPGEIYPNIKSFNNLYFYTAKNPGLGIEILATNGSDEPFKILDSDTNEPLNINNEAQFYNLNDKFLFFARNSTGSKSGLWQFNRVTKKGQLIFPELSGIYNGVILNSKLIFTTFIQNRGSFLISTDGTTENTFFLSDNNNLVAGISNQNHLYKLGDYIYFFPSINPRNVVWKTDGTRAGTTATSVTINDNYADIIKSFPENKKLMIADTKNNFFLLDQSETLTALGNNSLNGAVEIGNKAILPYTNEKNGRELFQYDFEANKLGLFFDGNHSVGSFPKNFKINDLNGLIFTANDYAHGNEFFSFKNAGDNPQLVKDFKIGSDNDSHYGIPEGELFKIGSYFYIMPNSSIGPLTRTNGSEGETKMLAIPLINNNVGDSSSYGNLNDKSLFFTTNNYSQNYEVTNLWKIDNDIDTPVLIKSLPVELTVLANTKTVLYDGYVFFTVKDRNGESQVWKTDGTSENTKLAFQIAPSQNFTNNPSLLQVFDSKLLINFKNKLWSFNNSNGDFTQVEITGNPDLSISDGYQEIDGKFYMLTQFGYGTVFRFDNLQTPPVSILSDNNMGSFSKFIKSGDIVYFATSSTKNLYNQLWAFNTQTNTISNIIPQNFSGNKIKSLTTVKNYLYFLKENGKQIWKSNGTAAGLTSLNLNVNNSPQLGGTDKITDLTSFDEKLYLVAETVESGSELYYVKTELPLYLSTTDINGSAKKNRLILYPNPASNFISLKNDTRENFEGITIYDLSGKIVKSFKNVKDNQSVDINSLNSGIYIIEAKTNKNVFSQKFIKK